MKNQSSALGRHALTHVALATAAVLTAASAWGLGLGRLSVQSALGETLKAEIDVTSLSAEEAGTLKVRIAPPESYRATGVEYNSVLTSTQVQVTRRDGRTFLRVSSERAVQEPFVDVILELSWASGRLVREYTLLFDPPANPKPMAAPPAVATAPVIAPAPVPAEAATAAVAAPAPSVAVALPPAAAVASRPASAAARPRPEPRVEPKPEVRAEAPRPAPKPAPAPAPTAASEYTVKNGDTLSRIANKTQAPGVSLDQMLVGLYRSNPDAFVDNNMNRLKAGSVLQVPASDVLNGLSSAEARQVIKAQSADFSAYRQRLAGAAPSLKQDENERQAKGRVQAAVEDRKPAAAVAPDKLTLSKAAGAAPEAKLSKDTEKKDAAARVAELTRNVEELKKLSSAAKPATAVPAPMASAAAPVPVPLPQPPVAVASAAASMAAAKPVAARASAVVAPAVAAVAAAPAVEEPGLLEQILGSSLLLPIGAVLLAALGGLGLYRMRGRKSADKADTGFHESRLQPDSFFGATGGQRVDTRDASGGASSMSYSLSQLDAIGDVDPVAEADVYLAYGRDLQAEEILKEALRANPERLAIRLKLLEVYAKRRDTKGFEQLAIQLFAETHGMGEDWARAQELGRQIDVDNPLYQPGGAPSQPDHGPSVHPEPMDASTMPHTVSAGASALIGAHLATEPLGLGRTNAVADSGPMSGFDLDLDLDLGAPPAVARVSPIAMEATQALATTVEQAPLAMDFDLSRPPPAAEPGTDLHFDLDDLGDLGSDDEPSTLSPAAAASNGNSLDFDLSSIDLDLPDSTPSIPVAQASTLEGLPSLDQAGDQLSQALDALGDEEGDPLIRQLELADEFRQIGDTEGAREVLQELLAKASGSLRERAQGMLNELR